VSSKVQPQPIPLSDAVTAILDTAIRRAHRVLKTADTTGGLALRGHSKSTRVGDVDVRIDVTVRGPECDLDVPELNPPNVWAGPSPTPDLACAALRPGFAQGGAAVRHRLPCVRVSAHAGDHVNSLGEAWPAHCADCGRIGVPLEELTTTEADGTMRDGHLCGPCAARATAPYAGVSTDDRKNLEDEGREPENFTVDRKDAGGTARTCDFLGSQEVTADMRRARSVPERVARLLLDEVRSTPFEGMTRLALASQRTALAAAVEVLLDALDEAQA
jgi:hypothetical protein